MQQSDASQSPAAASAADQLPVSAPLSAAAAAAAAASAADLRTLEQQIAANPPSGGPSPPPAADSKPGSAGAAASMPPSEYLGQTFDLFGDQNTTPQPAPRTPESIRRRARSARPHYGHQ
jgi:hypothetical protein